MVAAARASGWSQAPRALGLAADSGSLFLHRFLLSLLLLCLPRTRSSQPRSPWAAGFPLRLCLCCPRLHPGAGRAPVLVTVAAAAAASSRRQPGRSVGVGKA